MPEPTNEQLVKWIRDETLRRFGAEERDEHVPVYRKVLLEALTAAEARGAARLEAKYNELADQASKDTQRFIDCTKAVKALVPEATSLEDGIKRLEARVESLRIERAACEVCFTVSWEPIEKREDADGVNTIGPDRLARCGYCWLGKQHDALTAWVKELETRRLEDTAMSTQLKLEADALQAKLAEHANCENVIAEHNRIMDEYKQANNGFKAKLTKAEERERRLRDLVERALAAKCVSPYWDEEAEHALGEGGDAVAEP